MKFTITFKTPNAFDGIIQKLPTDCGDPICQEDPELPCKSCEEASKNNDAMLAVGYKFIEYGEYLYVEMDTETGTATVLPIVRR